jgi:maltose-binding protein MalE
MKIWCDNAKTAMLMRAAVMYSAFTGFNVKVVGFPFEEMLKELIVASPEDQPDLILGPHDWIGELRKSDLLAPVQIARSERFHPQALAAVRSAEQFLALPHSMESTSLVYNKRFVQTPPETWSELLASCQNFKKLGLQGLAVQVDPYHFHWMITAHGGYLLRQEENRTTVGLDSEGGLRAFMEIDRLREEGLLGHFNYRDVLQLLGSGRAAMAVTGPWALNALRSCGPDFGMSILPSESTLARPFVGVQVFMQLSDDKSARGFLEFIQLEGVNREMQKILPYHSALCPESISSAFPIVAQTLSVGELMPCIPGTVEIFNAYNMALTEIFNRNAEVTESVTYAAQTVRSIVAAAQ